MLLSVITPAYNETLNLPILYDRLKSVMESLQIDWEWWVIDDHSSDQTYNVVSELSKADARIKGIRFSRNYGAHTAITCGLHHAKGDCAVIMAADLQNPPEVVPALIEKWKEENAHIVWAVREGDSGERLGALIFAKTYYALTKNIDGLQNRPKGGMDYCLLDRRVLDAFNQFNERHVSIMSLIAWMGFKQVSIPHHREERLHGKSGWSFSRRLKLAVDTIMAFSYGPIRFISYVGFFTAVLGFLYALITIVNWVAGGQSPEGWATLMVVVLIMGGVQMIMMGVLGEYLWRTLDETRNRPRYTIENSTDLFDR